jgi:hypothetical protein
MDGHDMTYALVVGKAKNARGAIKLPTRWTIEHGNAPADDRFDRVEP